MDKLLFYAINNKVKSILFLLFITIISLMGYKDLGVDTRLSSLLNEQDSSKKIYDKFVDEFGSKIMHLWFELRQFNVINENKIKKFILNSSTNDGINLFNKELSYIKDAMINDYLTLSFKSKLLIQD